jgi:hypothetical protein
MKREQNEQRHAKLRAEKVKNPWMRARGPIEDRFWTRVEKTDGCWLWVGGKSPSGYGLISVGKKSEGTRSVHRLSYEMHHGPIPKGFVVMHSCDNRACVNPDHLSVGTHKDNTDDMIAKGRKRTVAPLGTQNGKSLLTEAQVRYIRSSPLGNAALGRELGVSTNCVRGVRTGRTWSHVE